MASSGDKLGGSGAGKEAGTFLRSFGKHVRGCPSKHQPVDRKRAAWSVLLLCAHGASHLQAQKETPVPTKKKLDKHSNCTEIRANTDSARPFFDGVEHVRAALYSSTVQQPARHWQVLLDYYFSIWGLSMPSTSAHACSACDACDRCARCGAAHARGVAAGARSDERARRTRAPRGTC